MRKEHPLSSADKGFAAKLAPKYSGPYTVIKVRSPVVYDLRDEHGRKVYRIHIKDLKPANKIVTLDVEKNCRGVREIIQSRG